MPTQQQLNFFEEIEAGATEYWGIYGNYTILDCDKYQDESWTWEEVEEEYKIFFEELSSKFWNSEWNTQH